MNIYPDSKIQTAGGVHFHGIKNTLARRTEPRRATHEAYSFTPYSSSLNLCDQDQTTVKYTQYCHIVAAEILKKALDNGISKTHTFSEKLMASTQKASENGIQDTQQLFSDPKANSYLEVLREMSAVPHDDKYSEIVTNTIWKDTETLQLDLLLGNLLHSKYLKHCVDIIAENTFSKGVKAVEVCFDGISKEIFRMLTSHGVLKASYSVATTDPEQFKHDSEKEKLQDVIKWQPYDNTDNLDRAQIIIANNVLRKHSNVKQTLRHMSELLGEDGFLLVHEVTTNFHVAAPIDGIYCNILPTFDDLNERTCSIYCDVTKWRQMFSEEGFDIIFETSDNLLSSLFLLRRKRSISVEKQTFMDINDSTCSWVEALKSKLKDLNSKPKGENLWLTANTYNSGIVGMMACLWQETGCEKLR